MADMQQLHTQLSGIATILSAQKVDSAVTKFNGEPRKFKTWVKDIEKHRIILNGATDSAKAIAYQSAEGPVSDFIQRTAEASPNMSWNELKTELAERFAEVKDVLDIKFHDREWRWMEYKVSSPV